MFCGLQSISTKFHILRRTSVITRSKYQPLQYYKALDGLRGYAVLMVLIFHVHLISWGWIGVHVFFVLSGFLITKILLRTKGSGHYYKTFYIRRILRIFPAYYAMLFATIAYSYYKNAPLEDAWMYILYVQNFKLGFQNMPTNFSDWFDHTWTLAVEEQFYLVFPFIVAACNLKTFRMICWLLIAAGFGAMLLHLVIHESRMFTFEHTIAYMPFLCAGALLATTNPESQPASTYDTTKTLSIISLIAIIIFASLTFVVPLTGSMQKTETLKGQLYLITALPVIVLTVHILSTYNFRLIRIFFGNSLITYLGKISYGIYLFHFPVFILCHVHRLPQVAAFGITFALAILSWHLFESKILALKYKFMTDKFVEDSLPTDKLPTS